MSYKVRIRKNSTGEERDYEFPKLTWEFPSENGSGSMFIWTEGNFSCDCNRYLFFERAGGNPADPDETEDRCGDDAYTVLHAELPDGKKVEIDQL